jgi:hypothetical protein
MFSSYLIIPCSRVCHDRVASSTLILLSCLKWSPLPQVNRISSWVIAVSDSSAHRASNASDSCVSLLPFFWASLVSNEVYWRFAIYVPWHRMDTYPVMYDESTRQREASPKATDGWPRRWRQRRRRLGHRFRYPHRDGPCLCAVETKAPAKKPYFHI